MMGTAVAACVALFFLSYGGAMSLNYLGCEKLKLLEERNLLTVKRRARYTFLVFSPVYLFWLLFSFLPVPSFEIWMVTGFPVMIVGFFSFHIYLEEWPRKAKWRFEALQVPIYFLCLLIGQCVGRTLFII